MSPPATPPEWEGEFVTSRQVAHFLGVHIRTVQRYARTGVLPSYSIPGNGYRFRRVEVEAFPVPNGDRGDPDPDDPEEGTP